LIPFRIVPPRGTGRALVAHIPHASIVIPAAVREELLISDDALAAELLRLTDWYTDELFAGLADLGATLFVNGLSRLVFDPERFLDDDREPAAAHGQGVVYTRGTLGQALRRPDPALRARRIEELYRPYHARLDGLVAETLERYGECTVIDCHSFPSRPLPTEIDRAPDRPDVCIGSDEFHTPVALADGLVAAFEASGYVVKQNAPYAGTFVPGGSYGTDARVHSVMIEVRRGLYMDESGGGRVGALASVASEISHAVAAAV
jgi:N-formylglutamate amidohydrolase